MMILFLIILLLPKATPIDFQTSLSCDLCHYFVHKIQTNAPLLPLVSWLEKTAIKVCT